MTLTELLVAVVLIGIVMMGIASFTFAVKSIQDSTSKASLLAMQTAAVMSHISKNAYLAIGDQGSPGIHLDPANAEDSYFLSIRQDRQNTPDKYTDDTWVIYIRDISSTNHRLYVCEQEEDDQGSEDWIPVRSSGGRCHPSHDDVVHLTSKFTEAKFDFVTDADAFEFYVEISLRTRHDPSSPIDPVDNPEYVLDTRVSPPSHSW